MANKKIQELKHGVLLMASQMNCEEKIRKVFNTFEKNIPNAWALPEGEIRTLLFKMSVAQGCAEEMQQSFTYFDKLPKRRKSESETRNGIVSTAQKMGVPREDVLSIFSKVDSLLQTASSESERQQISVMGAVEIHRLLDIKGPLVINGVEIIPPEPEYVEEDKSKFRQVN